MAANTVTVCKLSVCKLCVLTKRIFNTGVQNMCINKRYLAKHNNCLYQRMSTCSLRNRCTISNVTSQQITTRSIVNTTQTSLRTFVQTYQMIMMVPHVHTKCPTIDQFYEPLYKFTYGKQQLNWEPVIGLEIHAQILAETKLFSGASSKFGGSVNSQVAFLDTALPGTLPVLNKRCVEAGVLTAAALGCTINRVSRFDRKHYFYADLPAGYQITQQKQALANNGKLTYILYGKNALDCVEKSARILQLQLEQDSGKSLHDDVERRSLIDLNRAGCALMEIVTDADFRSGEEAKAFVRDLRLLLMALGTCNGNMSEGSLRVDANISVHRPGEPFGVRSEVKNVNSLTGVKKAIEFEIQRQIKVLESGQEVVNETRLYDALSGHTLPMRDKEAKQDYRFLPEPNLPPLHVHDSLRNVQAGLAKVVAIDQVVAQMPKLPRETRQSVMDAYGLSLFHAAILVNEDLLGYYEALVQGRDARKLGSFLINRLLAPLNERETPVTECTVPPSYVGDLFDWYTNENLSKSNVEKIMQMLLDDPSVAPKTVADTQDLWQINDDEYLTSICKRIMAENPSSVAKYKRGTVRGIDRLMGQAKKATHQKGNPVKLEKIFIKLMSE